MKHIIILFCCAIIANAASIDKGDTGYLYNAPSNQVEEEFQEPAQNLEAAPQYESEVDSQFSGGDISEVPHQINPSVPEESVNQEHENHDVTGYNYEQPAPAFPVPSPPKYESEVDSQFSGGDISEVPHQINPSTPKEVHEEPIEQEYENHEVSGYNYEPPAPVSPEPAPQHESGEDISLVPIEIVPEIVSEEPMQPEYMSHEVSGYNYEAPPQVYTDPPFMHQELASEQKKNRRGPVKRLKLKQPPANKVSPCAGSPDWKEVVHKRRQLRPKNRRLAPHKEVVVGKEYFDQE